MRLPGAAPCRPDSVPRLGRIVPRPGLKVVAIVQLHAHVSLLAHALSRARVSLRAAARDHEWPHAELRVRATAPAHVAVAVAARLAAGATIRRPNRPADRQAGGMGGLVALAAGALLRPAIAPVPRP